MILIFFFYNSKILLKMAKMHKRYKDAKEAKRQDRKQIKKQTGVRNTPQKLSAKYK
jgi:hypothetical protein